MIRTLPNIIITGTPGTGKTTHAASVAQKLAGHKHYSISDFAKENKLIESYDEQLDTYIVDEDKVLDALEPLLEKGGVIVDWHVADVFPERLIDLVVVLRTDNKKLHERLTARSYKDNKIQENLDCEIMEVIIQEVREAYKPEIVVELTSNTDDEIADNVERIIAWESSWKTDHPEGVSGEKRVGDDINDADEGDEGEIDEDLSEELLSEEEEDESEYEETEALDDDDDDDEKADYDVDEDDEEVIGDVDEEEEDNEKEDEEQAKEDIKNEADAAPVTAGEQHPKRRKTK